MDTARTSPIIAALSAVLVTVAPRASVAAVVPCSLTIDMGAAVPLGWSEAGHERFKREATRVWASEGVRFCWTDSGPCPRSLSLLYVRIVGETPVPADAAPGRTLGWMGFTERDGPGPLILLSERWAAELLGRAERGARSLATLPGMVQRLLPRALGRALAHELGHYLLGRREHSMSGVMRAAFRPEDLADEGVGQRMGLSAGDRRALRARCVEPTTLVTRHP
jgi:hypothetical protein